MNLRRASFILVATLCACGPTPDDGGSIEVRPMITDVRAHLSKLHGSERLLVFSGGELDTRVALMRDRLTARAADAEERNLTVAWLTGPGRGTLGGQRLSSTAVDDLRLIANLDSNGFGGVLFDASGAITERYTDAVDVDLIFAIIDLLPPLDDSANDG